MANDPNLPIGWYEFLKYPNNTTHIAYVGEGYVYTPDATEQDFRVAWIRNNIHRLVRAEDIKHDTNPTWFIIPEHPSYEINRTGEVRDRSTLRVLKPEAMDTKVGTIDWFHLTRNGYPVGVSKAALMFDVFQEII